MEGGAGPSQGRVTGDEGEDGGLQGNAVVSRRDMAIHTYREAGGNAE